MQLTFWGTRGSIPAPGPDTARYGGNTTCIELTSAAGETVVLDAGSGIRSVAGLTAAPRTMAILLTHVHWDAIQGLPFFDLLFQPGHDVTLYGPRPTSEMSLREALEIQMRPPHFPITMERIECRFQIVEVAPGGAFDIGSLRVVPHQMEHPGGLALGYRVDESPTGESLALAPDNELPLMSRAQTQAMAEWARNVDLLVHDAQYTPEEYPIKRGWGHSTFDIALDLARAADATALAFTHHDPRRTDEALDGVAADVCERDAASHPGATVKAFAAVEGTTVLLSEAREGAVG